MELRRQLSDARVQRDVAIDQVKSLAKMADRLAFELRELAWEVDGLSGRAVDFLATEHKVT